MSSRKIIIPKGLVKNPEQNSIIEVSPRLNQTSGNLIAKRQGKKLVAQQLPDWHDALSSPGGSVPDNSFFATPAGCRPPRDIETFRTPYSTAGTNGSRTNETFYSAYSTMGRSRDNAPFYSGNLSFDDYQSAISHDPDATYTKTCYRTPVEESPSRAHLGLTGKDSSFNATIESNIQMSDAMLANVVNQTRTILPSPETPLSNVRQRLFTSGSSPTPASNQTYARLNLTRENLESSDRENSGRGRFFDSGASGGSPIASMNKTYGIQDGSGVIQQRPGNISNVRRQLFNETSSSSRPASCSPCHSRQPQHTMDETYSRPSPTGFQQLDQSLEQFRAPDHGRTFQRSPVARRRIFTPDEIGGANQTFSRTYADSEDVHSPCNRQQVANKTFDVPRSTSSPRSYAYPDDSASPKSFSPGKYRTFQPDFFSTPQATDKTYFRPTANDTFNVPPANRTASRCGGAATCGTNETFARPNLHQTYDANYSPYSTLEDSAAYVPTSPKTMPRAKTRRTGRPRRGEETYPRSFNRSNIEDGTFMDSDNFWSGSSSSPCARRSHSPSRQSDETITDYPTDESYDMKFHPELASTQRSLSELQDSSDDLMWGFGPGNRSEEGKYNIITPMTPSPQKTKVKDCSCAPEGPESLVSYSSQVVEDVYEER